nr:hypothetical protein [Tanacetum cinerariifolium]
MFSQFESGGASGSGGCRDEEEGADHQDDEDEDGDGDAQVHVFLSTTQPPQYSHSSCHQYNFSLDPTSCEPYTLPKQLPNSHQFSYIKKEKECNRRCISFYVKSLARVLYTCSCSNGVLVRDHVGVKLHLLRVRDNNWFMTIAARVLR